MVIMQSTKFSSAGHHRKSTSVKEIYELLHNNTSQELQLHLEYLSTETEKCACAIVKWGVKLTK